MKERASIARVDVRGDAQSNIPPARGTAVLVSERLALTALHVVANESENPDALTRRIELVFPQRTVSATILRGMWNREQDWALLECGEEPGAPVLCLSELYDTDLPQQWSSYGFPELKDDGFTLAGSIVNVCDTYQGVPAIALHCPVIAGQEDVWMQGMSGGPVIVDGSVVGIVRAGITREDKSLKVGILYACPTTALLDKAWSAVRADGQPILDFATKAESLRYARKKLSRWTERWTRGVRDLVGDGFNLPRIAELERLSDTLLRSRVVVVLGESGVGKSSLVKHLVREKNVADAYFCVDAGDFAEFFSSNALDEQQSVENELCRPSRGRLLIVLDGVERLHGHDKVKAIAHALQQLKLNDSTSSWRLVMTCQSVAWDWVGRELRAVGAQVPEAFPFRVDVIDTSEIDTIARECKFLAPLLRRQDLLPITSRLKVLDIVARAALEIGLPENIEWVGESDVIAWFWKQYVCGSGRDDRHGNLLKKLAKQIADDWKFVVATSTLDLAEIALVEDLVKPGLLLKIDESVRFAHDLYADYARQRYIMGAVQAGKLDALQSRTSNPVWHRAIRLYAQSLCEDPHDDGRRLRQWKTLLREIDAALEPTVDPRSSTVEDEEKPMPGAGADLMLEAIAYSVRPGRILDRLHDELRADQGLLLRRFLVRFAQMPKRSFKEVKPGSDVLMPDIPMPDYPLWNGTVDWIVANPSDILKFAPNEFVEIAEIWLIADFFWSVLLRDQKKRLVNSTEIAEMITLLAEQRGRQAAKKVKLYRLLLQSAVDHPKRIVPVLLELAGRTRPAPVPATKTKARAKMGVPEEMLYLLQPIATSAHAPIPDAWPDGPRQPADDAFRTAALSPDGAWFLVQLDPAFAREVFLSLLIDVPSPRDVYNYSSLMDRLGLVEASRHDTPPFYDFPPARQLLDHNPAIGVDFVLRLVNFATERWIEGWKLENERSEFIGPRDDLNFCLQYSDEGPRIFLKIGDDVKEYLGDRRVFEWNCGHTQAPRWASAALMALEKWLYERDDAGDLQPTILKDIFNRARSVAIVGVLFDLGLKNPTLLKGPLEPLVGSIDLYRWANTRRLYLRGEKRKGAMYARGGQSRERWNLAREWHELPHRYHDFAAIVLDLFRKSACKWIFLERATIEWRLIHKQLGEHPDGNAIIYLIATFDPATWKRNSQDASWEPHAPAHVQEMAQRDLQEAERERPQWARAEVIRYCRDVLEGTRETSELAITELLEYAKNPKQVGNSRSARKTEWLTGDVVSLRCAVAAVAIVKMSPWLAKEPKWVARCKQWILKACLQQPLSNMLAHEMGNPLVSWSRFCMRAIIALWGDAPKDKDVRLAVGILVAESYKYTMRQSAGNINVDERSLMFVELASIREKLGDDFRRLLHLAVWFSRLQQIGQAGPRDTAPDVNGTFKKLVEAFVAGKLPLLPENWSRMVEQWPPKLHPSKKWPAWVREDGRDVGFEPAALVSAMAWIPYEASTARGDNAQFVFDTMVQLNAAILQDLGAEPDELPIIGKTETQARSSESRKPSGCLGRVLSMFKDDATTLTTPKKTIPKRRNGVGYPGDHEHTIARWCSALVVRERDASVRQRLWEPWLSVHPTRTDWACVFLRSLCREGLAEVPATKYFVEAFVEIFEEAIRAGGWMDRDVRGFGRSDIARSFLLQADDTFENTWGASRASLAHKLWPYWQRWVELAMRDSWSFRNFLWLVQAPALRRKRREALTLVSNATKAEWLKDGETQRALVSLLRQIEEERMQAADLGDDERRAYIKLLATLISLQNPEAIVLAGKLSHSM